MKNIFGEGFFEFIINWWYYGNTYCDEPEQEIIEVEDEDEIIEEYILED